MKLIIIGPSGSGKGTVAEMLKNDYGIPSISTGELFRKNVADGTELGIKSKEYMEKGQWVPDEITIDMVLKRISERDCANGFILDGYPRTLQQAKMLDGRGCVDVVIELDVSNEIVMKRLLGRWMCKGCGAIHSSNRGNISNCKKCGSVELYQRDDDKEEKIISRLKQYRENEAEIHKFYSDKGNLITVTVDKEIAPGELYERVWEKLKEHTPSSPNGESTPLL